MTPIDEARQTGIRRGKGWSLIAKVLARHRRGVAGILLATLGVYVFSLAVPIVTQNIIDGITGRKPIWSIGLLGLLAVGCALADVVLADRRRSMVIRLGQQVDRHVALEIMARLLGARLDTRTVTTGEVLNRTEQTNKIKTFLVDLVPGAIFDIGGAVIAAAVIFAYSLWCGVAVVAVTAAGFWLARNVLQSFFSRVSAQFKLENEKQGFLAETVGGMATIKALAVEAERFRLWAAKVKAVVAAYGQTEHVHRRFLRINRLSQHLLTLAVVGVGGVELMRGLISIGDLFAILMLAGKVSGPLLGAADVARQYQEVAVALRELGDLLDTPQDRTGRRALRLPLSGAISFRDVTYRYHGGAAPALVGFSLSLPRAGLIAVIGRNGSGKSTFIKLVQGLLRDFDGSVTIGGTDIRAYHPRWLRSQMAIVNQDTVLFAGTIRENVASWASKVADERIEAALRLADAWDFVQRLPDRLGARLIENGANLSGGQRQRLSIARAVLRDPQIVLLDEPTAFLDAEAAVNLERRLCAWGVSRLMILVTHHLSAARLADTIILLDAGRLVAQGSHAELHRDCPLYRSLWSDYLRGTGVDGSTAPGSALLGEPAAEG